MTVLALNSKWSLPRELPNEQPQQPKEAVLQGQVNQQQQPISPQDQQMQSQDQPYNAEDESPLETLLRGAARTGVQGAALVGGSAGDIANLGFGAANWATGGRTPSYKDVQGALPVSLPTSSQIKEKAGELTGGYTNPQSETEERIGDVLETIGSLYLPGKAGAKFAKGLGAFLSADKATKVSRILLPFSGRTMSLGKAATVGAAGEAAKTIAEAGGASPFTQQAIKVGTMVYAQTRGGRKELEGVMEKNYEKAYESLKPEPGELGIGKGYININPIRQSINRAKNKLLKSADPAKDQLLDFYGEAESAIDNMDLVEGRARAQDVLGLKRGLNKWVSNIETRESFKGQRHLPKASRPDVVKTVGMVKERLEDFGKANPEFNKSFQVAEDLFKGFNDLGETTQWLSDNVTLKNMVSKAGSSGIAGAGLAATMMRGGLQGLGTLAVGVGGAKIARDASLFMNLLGKSPAAKKHYIDAITAASKNNGADFTRSMSRLTDASKKEYGF